jgi:quinol monooxygenase YgiN
MVTTKRSPFRLGEYGRTRSAVTLIVSTLRIVVAPRSRAVVVRTLAAQLGPTRVQPGCLRCDLLQDLENRDAITLREEWAAQAELDLRLRAEDYRAVLAAMELSCEPPGIRFDTVTRCRGWARAAVVRR